MNKKKLWTVIGVVAFGLQLITQILTTLVIWRLNILPAEYAVPMLFGFALLLLPTGLLLFLPGKKKPSARDRRRVAACTLALIIVCACAAASIAASNLYETLQEVTTAEPQGIIRSVYVRADDPAQTLEDTVSYQFAYAQNYDEDYTKLAIEHIEKKLNTEIAIKTFSSVPETVDGLLAGQADAVVLNDAYVSLLQENEEYADFADKIRLLCDIEIDEKKTEQIEENRAPVFTAPKRITTSPFVMYLSGSDTRSTKLDVSRSDVNILVVVNPVTKQILLLNTPRDYYVPNPAGGGALDKLTHCGIYGIECSVQALSDLYNVPINFYSQINFTGFETLIDAIDGVTVFSDMSFTAGGETWIQAGENHLYGADALNFARERYNLSGGDNARGKNQMKVIKAVVEKMTSGTTLIKNYSEVLESMEGMFVTNLKPTDISLLVKMQLGDMAQWNINSFAVTGTGGSEKTYSMPGSYAYVMYPNDADVAHAADLIQKVISGGILTEADMQNP